MNVRADTNRVCGDRVDRAIKMEQRGGERTISTLHARGREKMAGKVVQKKRGTRGNSLFSFFFFSSHSGHVQNLNHPGPRFVLLAARYRADFAPPRNFERSHANSASLRRHDNDCEPVLGLTGP